MVNLEIKSDFREDLLRTLLGLFMTVERMECTDATGLNAVTKCMLHIRNGIPWRENREAQKDDSKDCSYFGKWFELGRDI